MRMLFPWCCLYVLFVCELFLFLHFLSFSNSDYSIFNRAVPISVCVLLRCFLIFNFLKNVKFVIVLKTRNKTIHFTIILVGILFWIWYFLVGFCFWVAKGAKRNSTFFCFLNRLNEETKVGWVFVNYVKPTKNWSWKGTKKRWQNKKN